MQSGKHCQTGIQHGKCHDRSFYLEERTDGNRPKKLAFLSHKYYTGKLGKNELPPDICIEIALWDRFGWGPKETEEIDMKKIREMFVVLEQQRVSRDAIENLGRPSEEKFNNLMVAKAMKAPTAKKP